MDLLVEICGHKRRCMTLDARLELCVSQNTRKRDRSKGARCICMGRGNAREWNPALRRALWLRRENGSWIEEICMESKCNMNVFSGWLRKDGVWKAECEREVKLVRAE